ASNPPTPAARAACACMAGITSHRDGRRGDSRRNGFEMVVFGRLNERDKQTSEPRQTHRLFSSHSHLGCGSDHTPGFHPRSFNLLLQLLYKQSSPIRRSHSAMGAGESKET